MEINDSYPWIQLGYEDIYVRHPGQSIWEVLSQDDVSWAARLSLSSGQEFLRQPGQKLGLIDSDAARQLDQVVLKQLLDLVGEKAVLFAPPRQVNGLQCAAQELASPPYAITLDSRLMVNQEPVSFGGVSETDIYFFDWRNIN